ISTRRCSPEPWRECRSIFLTMASARSPCCTTFCRFPRSVSVSSPNSARRLSSSATALSPSANSSTSSTESPEKLFTKLSGFLISCAMPAVSCPSEASFSVWIRRSWAVRRSSSEAVRSSVRWRSSLRRRAFSMAITAWAAKFCTKACLQSPDCEESSDEIEEPGRASVGLFVAGCDASECLEGAEEVLDQMTPFVHFGIMRDAPGAVGLGGDDRCSTAFVQVGAQPVVVEGLVADQRLKIEAGDQRLDADAVVTLARQQHEANEIAEGVDQGHDFGGQATPRAAYGLILSPPFAPVPCWWTRTSVPSMRTYSKSASSQRALKTRSQTPFCAQRQKRVYTVNHLPNASGKSRHGEPVRAIQRTASMKSRLSRPLLPGSPTLPNSSGAIRSHWASLNINRIKADLHFQP